MRSSASQLVYCPSPAEQRSGKKENMLLDLPTLEAAEAVAEDQKAREMYSQPA